MSGYVPVFRLGEDGRLKHVVPPGGPVCDFCTDNPAAYCYPCQTFVVEAVGWRSVGSWAACASCAALIELGNLEELARRSTHPRAGEPAVVTEARLGMVRAAHAAFMVNRAGPRHAHHPNEDVGPHPAPRPTG